MFLKDSLYLRRYTKPVLLCSQSVRSLTAFLCHAISAQTIFFQLGWLSQKSFWWYCIVFMAFPIEDIVYTTLFYQTHKNSLRWIILHVLYSFFLQASSFEELFLFYFTFSKKVISKQCSTNHNLNYSTSLKAFM